MRDTLAALLRRMAQRMSAADDLGIRHAPPDLFEQVERARREWHTARAYFENVTDPALIDHAIAVLDAAEKKYMYLMGRARAAGFSGHPHAPGMNRSPSA